MRLRMLIRIVTGLTLGTVVAASAFAQYGGGGTGGTGSGTGGYTPPKGGYSSSTGIAIGAAAAAGVAVAVLALHYRGTVEGCVEPSSNGLKLLNEKDKKTYSLEANNLGLKAGEMVKVRGKKEKGSAGQPAFQAKKLVKNLGSCKQEAALHKPSSQ